MRERSTGPRHPLEFVPATDPAALRVGDTLVVRLFYRGRPQPGVRVHAGAVPWPADLVAPDSHDAATSAANGAAADQPSVLQDLHLTTDASGLVRLLVMREGLWNLRTLHVVQSEPDSGADWGTQWAPLIVLVRGERE